MRVYLVFLKKELIEAFKTYKLLIMGAVFIIFGILSPLSAKMMPDIIKWAMQTDPSTAGIDLAAIFSEPKALDAWSQFYSNIGQIGLLVLMIIFSGMIASELSEDKLTLILTKGLSRSAVIISKLSSSIIIWTVSYTIAFSISWVYTNYYFSDYKLPYYYFPDYKLPYLLFAGFCLWLFGVFLLSLLTLMATLTKKSSMLCLLSLAASFIILNIFNILPYVKKYNPITLGSTSIALLSDTITPRAVYPTLIIAVFAIVALTIFATIFFSAKAPPRIVATLIISLIASISVTVMLGEDIPARLRLNRYVISEMVVIGADTKWELAGILTLPKNAQDKVPAVVLVHGSGSSDMDETIFDNKPFRDIAEYLSRNGVAVLRYNKRSYTYGYVISQENDGGFTVWEETIEDAILATQLLKSDPRIDENRVFILGHSLGGMLAPRIHAMGGDYAGLIIFAGSPRFLLDIMKDQQFAALDMLEDGDKKAIAIEESYELFNSIERALKLTDEEAMTTNIEGVGPSAYYFKDMYDNPTSEYISNISIPFLVMQANADLQVYTNKDYALYLELLDGRSNVTFKLYEGLNHLFMPAKVSNINEVIDEYRIKSSVDKQALEDIVDWILNH
ncbi:MAG: alpha/beta fold hydrolase [Oscillospiraceae bacterium]|nr:alpha/beta fold hydrolase [Oscillospiraceae bacterium]